MALKRKYKVEVTDHSTTLYHVFAESEDDATAVVLAERRGNTDESLVFFGSRDKWDVKEIPNPCPNCAED